MPLLQEFRFALRALRRSPWFTLTAVLMLSIGLGLAMFMFGAIQSFALRPPPFPNGARLVHIEYADARSNEDSIEMPIQDFLDVREVQGSLVSMEGFTSGTINLSGDDRPERYNGAFVTASAFAALLAAEQGDVVPQPGQVRRHGQDPVLHAKDECHLFLEVPSPAFFLRQELADGLRLLRHPGAIQPHPRARNGGN